MNNKQLSATKSKQVRKRRKPDIRRSSLLFMSDEERDRLTKLANKDGMGGGMRREIHRQAVAAVTRKRTLLEAAAEGYDFGRSETEISQMASDLGVV